MSSTIHRLSLFAFSLLIVFGAFGVDDARAQADDEALLIPVDGFLTDLDDRPIDEQTEVTFALYATASADDPFWTETHQLEVDGGAF